MITIHAEFHSHFREVAQADKDSFELNEPTVAELAEKICAKYGAKMTALLVDPKTKELNTNGTMYVDSKGKRIYMEDTLEDGETIAFLVGIAGG